LLEVWESDEVAGQSEYPPAESRGGVVFFAVFDESSGLCVATLVPHASLNLNGDLRLFVGEIKPPLSGRMKFKFFA
tara:strand:+ start:410 stop:637 length:228 start_codon:yes stop_codon:yes gene_type:complete